MREPILKFDFSIKDDYIFKFIFNLNDLLSRMGESDHPSQRCSNYCLLSLIFKVIIFQN